ncbi:hypothetical protein [Nocardia brasiliensis]|uniref:hypothetical protein n=1 Tax=Nocardia brasiliensis TaxID=37326 RepID=UPI0018962093|nr:hypothetical protein [Nocardia brasiliensis]MBF6124281.1 hypothetical protein [Nocardia brasiliensis]
MNAVLPALIAVAGTLLGSGVTFFIQRSTADREVSQVFAERLRQDRLNAYNAFADAAVEYRGAEYDRWFRLREGEDEATRSAIQAAHSKRSVVQSALLRIALLTNDTQLYELGSESIHVTRSISHATSPEQREERGDQAKTLLDTFIKQAAADIQNPPIRPQPPIDGRRELNG